MGCFVAVVRQILIVSYQKGRLLRQLGSRQMWWRKFQFRHHIRQVTEGSTSG
jgi:hypothetical protein